MISADWICQCLDVPVGTPVVPLDAACQEFLGLSRPVALRKARTNQLPFPAFRAYDSQKSPWFVDVQELASYLTKRRQVAADEYRIATS